jgi:glyoxylase-like metal-dependent hydrolase (beta-lactamase superfamily II)
VRVNDDVHILPLPMEYRGQTSMLNVTLVVDPGRGNMLVDTGLPGQRDLIEGGLGEVGLTLEDVTPIVVTHQDLDHVGSLHALVEASGARVLAHEIEAPFIDGRRRPRFATPERLAQAPEMRPIVERFQFTAVDETLRDGSRLDVAGGVLVVHTPGHTPGHICLYLERSGTLIAGDALTAGDGRLQGPNPTATLDMEAAMRSVRRLAELDVETIVCYHGGVVREEASSQLRRVAEG